MNVNIYENKLREELEKTVTEVICDKTEIPISANSRAGAEISDYLEKRFVEYAKYSKYLTSAEAALPGKTKNPYDAKVIFTYNGISEIIWIDFKTFKVTQLDSNPDIGTPNKVINFIKEGNYYIIFILVFYRPSGEKILFVESKGKFVESYLLKDINHTFRRNPKNQLQVNVSAVPEYRSREDFINLFIEKLKESHARQIKISHEALKEIENIRNLLIEKNRESLIKFKNS